MLMKNPAHPGRIILSDLKALRMTIEETARKLNVSPEELKQVISGQAAITPEMAAGLGILFGDDGGIWLRMQAAYDEAQERNKDRAPRTIPEPAENPD